MCFFLVALAIATNVVHGSFHFNLRGLNDFKTMMNDPNGASFINGKYHMCYQLGSDGATNMNHTSSVDLLHWDFEEEGCMVAGPDDYDSGGVWSGGGGFVEGDETWALSYRSRGGGSAPAAPGVAIATTTDFKTWKKEGIFFADIGSDGLPIWTTTKDGKFIAGGNDGSGKLITYSTIASGFSSDATAWKRDEKLLFDTSTLENWVGLQCCCPDFFPSSGSSSPDPVSDAEVKWIVKTSGYISEPKRQSTPDYFLLGTYKEGDFVPDGNRLFAVDYGAVFASQTMYDSFKNRRILLGWTGEYNNTHSIPREITTVRDGTGGDSLLFYPIEEVETTLRIGEGSVVTSFSDDFNKDDMGEQMDFLVKVNCSDWDKWSTDKDAKSFGIEIRKGGKKNKNSVKVAVNNVKAGEITNSTWNSNRMDQTFRNGAGLDGATVGVLTIDRGEDPSGGSAQMNDLRVVGGWFVLPKEGEVEIRVLVDGPLVEAFVERGRAAVTTFAPYLDSDYDPTAIGAGLFAEGERKESSLSEFEGVLGKGWKVKST